MAYHFSKSRFCSIIRVGWMEVRPVRRTLQSIKPVEMGSSETGGGEEGAKTVGGR